MEVAISSSVLFFCVVDLENINYMYQYSLKWFKMLFKQAVMAAEKSDQYQQRVANCIIGFKKKLYTDVCKTIFDKDRMLFAFNFFMKLQL